MLTYAYDPTANVTVLTDGVGGPLIEVLAGRVPHSTIHERYAVVVFEVLKEPDIVALPPVTE